MKLVIALVASVVFVALFRRPLAKYPALFYGLAVICDVALVRQVLSSTNYPAVRALFPYICQGIFAFGLLAIVMYIGVLPQNSRLRRALLPIRGQLSIFASILMAGHGANYIGSYVAQRLNAFATLPPNEVAGLCTAVILGVLLLILAVTSVAFVRKAMPSTLWKNVQRLAYPFFALIYLHLVLLLAPSAVARGGEALVDLAVYTAAVLGYGVLRLWRALCDNRARTKVPVSRGRGGIFEDEPVRSA